MKAVEHIFMLFKDILRCVFIGCVVGLGLSVFAVLTALVFRYNVGELVYRFEFYAGMLALLVAGLSFFRPDTTRPFDYEDRWKAYFKKLNIAFVIMFIGLTLVTIGSIAYSIFAPALV